MDRDWQTDRHGLFPSKAIKALNGGRPESMCYRVRSLFVTKQSAGPREEQEVRMTTLRGQIFENDQYMKQVRIFFPTLNMQWRAITFPGEEEKYFLPSQYIAP